MVWCLVVFVQGINIPQIRTVICYGAANSAELVQKAGRAGRDQLPALVEIRHASSELSFRRQLSIKKQSMREIGESFVASQ